MVSFHASTVLQVRTLARLFRLVPQKKHRDCPFDPWCSHVLYTMDNLIQENAFVEEV